MKTTWKPVEGYETRYKISDTGLVYSTPQDGKPTKLLRQEVNRKNHTNYRRVSLSKGGVVTRFLVHRLVAIHFIDNPSNKDQVNHIDHNGENNNVSNLEWVTGSENMIHSHQAGRQKDTSRLGQKASAIVRRNSKIAEIEALVGNTFGYLTIKGHRVDTIKAGTRLKTLCECTRCNNNVEVVRELVEITSHKKELQCRGCVKKYGKDIN